MTPTINQAIQFFQRNLHSEKVNSQTLRAYKYALQAWARSLDAEGLTPVTTSLEELQPSVALDFAVWLQNNSRLQNGDTPPPRSLSPATIHLYLTGLRRALKMWRTHNWISFSSEQEKNYFDAHRVKSHYDPVKEAQKRAKEVPEDFGPRMWAAVKGIRFTERSGKASRQRRLYILRDQALIAVLVSTGLRINDVCSLSQRHLDEAKKNDGSFVLTSEKTDTRTYCHLPPFAIDALDNYLNARDPGSSFIFQKQKKNKSKTSSPSSRRNSLTTGTARSTIYKVAHLAYGDNLPEFFGPHAFRHWFAQNRIAGGAPLDQVQSQLGHASPVTTKLIYAPEPNIKAILKSEIAFSENLINEAAQVTNEKLRSRK